ncbi:fibronectin type III domain-containing protein [Fulvivirgaceae bacterium BMA10]|uniref:Fibronectin type III domain-containing protein n=1 Tax=Splendidivirga corallicola TaxID=3051826 RepID=A0ABT8KVY1_9BACT|nr:fibronectin type III domain-containing protein [Fulvivirgaceae bacterium BMA10]
MSIIKPKFLFNILVIQLLFANQFLSTAQTIEKFNFKPQVIRFDQTLPVLFEVIPKGDFTNVVFEYEQADRPMLDDGSGGDLIAGDGIYSISFEANEIIDKLEDSDVFRPFIGFCKLVNNTEIKLKLNVFAEIWTPDIPPVPQIQLASDIIAGPNIINIIDQVPTGSFDFVGWTQKFFDHFNDDYDFINIVIAPSQPGNRFHFQIKNDVQGIGSSIFDNTDQYGSNGKLQGINFFPISFFFDGASTAYQHELGHQWINHSKTPNLSHGAPHWPISDLASGIMGWNITGSLIGGSFPYSLIPEGENYRLEFLGNDYVPSFNDLELYFMGLLPADSVKTHFVFDNQNQTPANGQLLLGPISNITIENILASDGPRVPNYKDSQKKFRLATIIITEKALDADEMAFYNYFSLRAESEKSIPIKSGFKSGLGVPFYLSTDRRGELDTHIGDQPRSPQSLTAEPQSPTEIRLSWKDKSDNETGFIIERSTPQNNDFVELVTLNSDDTTFLDIGLTENTYYYYRLKAINTIGVSAYSNITNAKTLDDVVNIPEAPTKLTAMVAQTIQVNLSWIDNSNNETGFTVERAILPGNTFNEIAITNPDVTTYTDNNLMENTTYLYRVKANGITLDSEYTNEIEVNLSITGIGKNHNEKAKIYPNPSSGLFTIELKNRNLNHCDISIIDVLGRSVTFSEYQNKNFKKIINVNTSNHLPGVYFLKMRFKNQLVYESIILKK